MEIFDFNSYWSFILTVSFAYAFADKNFARQIFYYFKYMSWDERQNKFYSQASMLTNFKEQLDTLKKAGNDVHQKEYVAFRVRLEESINDHRVSFERFERLDTSRFLTRNFKTLSYLAGIFAILLIISGAFVRRSVNEDVVYGGIRWGIYSWGFIIISLFLLDVIPFLRKRGIQLHFSSSILFVLIILIIIHFRSYYVCNHLSLNIYFPRNQVLIMLLVTSISHIVLYFLFAIAFTFNRIRLTDRNLKKLEETIDSLKVELEKFITFDKWSIDLIQSTKS